MEVAIVNIFAEGDYDAQIARVAEVLRAGNLAIIPTETVYGTAGLIGNPSARERLAALRGGDASRPFTLHIARPDDAFKYIGQTNEYGRRLVRKLWPGPVALAFDVPAERQKEVANSLGLSPAALYENGTITLRCPDHVVAIDVLSAVEGPIALTATPVLGGLNWTDPEAAAQLEGKVNLVVDAGPTKYSKPSTMLKVGADRYEIVRQGVYDERIIERLLRTTILFVCSGNTCRSPMAEAITRHLLSQKLAVPEPDLEKKGISVMSAGSYALPGAGRRRKPCRRFEGWART